MINLCHDNILVTELHKDSKAGALIVNQDESSAYIFVKIEGASKESIESLNLDLNKLDDTILIINRVAKIPFIQNKFFVSYKDVIAIIDKDYFERI